MKSSTSEINCPICKSTNFDNIGLYKNKHNFFSNIKLTKCKKCKLVFANPMPSPEELDSRPFQIQKTHHSNSEDLSAAL